MKPMTEIPAEEALIEVEVDGAVRNIVLYLICGGGGAIGDLI